VFVIVMENHSYGEIVGSASAPYANRLIGSGALATSYYAAAHPSLPNHLALTGASTFGVTSDCTTCWVAAANLGDRLEAAGSTWKAYEESMPSPCFVGDSYPYAQKHDPFIYFNDIRTNASRCQSHVVPYTQLATDLKSTSTTPNFAFITPNMCNDMHDCSVATGDSWLQAQVPAILDSPAFTTQHSLLAITWDEDDSSASNRVATIFAGAYVGAAARVATSYNHYSLLRTIEAARGLSTLTANDANASAMTGMFVAAAAPGVACTSVDVSASPVSPQPGGGTVTVTATAHGCASPQLEFWLAAPGASAYALKQAYSAGATFSWSTSGAAAGTYRFSVWARDATSPGVYGNTAGRWDTYNADLVYSVTTGTPPCQSVATSGTNGTGSVTVSATASGCANPQYEFWILAPGATAYTLGQAYSSSPTFAWTINGLTLGKYRINVWARDAASAGVYGNSVGRWDAYNAYLIYTLS
jgi:acid phosphatase